MKFGAVLIHKATTEAMANNITYYKGRGLPEKLAVRHAQSVARKALEAKTPQTVEKD